METSLPVSLSDTQCPDVEYLEALSLTYQTICVVGLGYVGLPTALLFAMNGYTVHGVDVSSRVLDSIAHSKVGEVYPELSNWWETVRKQAQFKASATPEPADVFLITVPTSGL
jgi:UDP-N-acetyl-D-mannosaminuronic acid dehydrogenase